LSALCNTITAGVVYCLGTETVSFRNVVTVFSTGDDGRSSY